MKNEIYIETVDESAYASDAPIAPSALGAEFLGWEFFSNFESRHQEIGFNHVRWPGGIPIEEGINIDNSPDGSREQVFDLTYDNLVDWDRAVEDITTGEPTPREGIREMMSFAVEQGASFAMIAPTMRYIETAFSDPEQGLEEARLDIRVFAERLLGGEFGALPREFVLEIGSEYYSLPIWKDNFNNVDIARTAGDVFAAMVDELDQVLKDPELNPTGYDINIAVQLGRSFSRDDDPTLGFDQDGVINGGWGEDADNTDFIQAFQDAGSLDAVDSLIFHRYVSNFWGIERGLWEPVNGGLVLSDVIGDWEDAAGRELGLVAGHLSPAAQGRDKIEFHAPGLTNILQLTTGLLAEGMDHGTVFGIGFGSEGALAFRDELFLGAQLYSMMTESLPGMFVRDGFQSNTSNTETVWEDGRVVDQFIRVDESINSFVFENDDQVVIFLTARDFAGETLQYSLTFEEFFERTDIARLTDTGERRFDPRSGDLLGHVGEITHEKNIDIIRTEIGSKIDISFTRDFEVIRVTLDRSVIDEFEGTPGDDIFRINDVRDTIATAGAGVDTVISSVNFTLRNHSTGRDIENLRFVGSGHLNGTGNAEDNIITGNDGDNHLSGVWGDDTVSGGLGDDTVMGEQGNDVLFGGRGNDELHGGSDDDKLFGGDGNDMLFGGGGDDVLSGGFGIDTLIGGEGNDRFVIAEGVIGSDIIVDFTFAEDILDISSWPIASFDDLSIVYTSGRIQIQDEFGSSFVLEGLPKEVVTSLSPGDFLLAGGDVDGKSALSEPEQENDRLLTIDPDAANPWLTGAQVLFTPDDGPALSIMVDEIGRFDLSAVAGQTGLLHISRNYTQGDPEIGVRDALNILRVAVGLEASFGRATPGDLIAADLDQDGEVTVRDAFDALRFSVGLETPNMPEWLFLDGAADLTEVSSGKTLLTEGIQVTVPEAGGMEFDMTAILLGSTEGWA